MINDDLYQDYSTPSVDGTGIMAITLTSTSLQIQRGTADTLSLQILYLKILDRR